MMTRPRRRRRTREETDRSGDRHVTVVSRHLMRKSQRTPPRPQSAARVQPTEPMTSPGIVSCGNIRSTQVARLITCRPVPLPICRKLLIDGSSSRGAREIFTHYTSLPSHHWADEYRKVTSATTNLHHTDVLSRYTTLRRSFRSSRSQAPVAGTCRTVLSINAASVFIRIHLCLFAFVRGSSCIQFVARKASAEPIKSRCRS